MYHFNNICAVLCVFVVVLNLSNAKPTIYKVNANDKLEPVLIPVSSTVIPLAVYKVEFGISLAGGKGGKQPSKPDEPVKLITAPKKKATTEQTSIKQISKDEYEKQ